MAGSTKQQVILYGTLALVALFLLCVCCCGLNCGTLLGLAKRNGAIDNTYHTKMEMINYEYCSENDESLGFTQCGAAGSTMLDVAIKRAFGQDKEHDNELNDLFHEKPGPHSCGQNVFYCPKTPLPPTCTRTFSTLLSTLRASDFDASSFRGRTIRTSFKQTISELTTVPVSQVSIISVAHATPRTGVTIIFSVQGEVAELDQLSAQMADDGASGFATIFVTITASAGVCHSVAVR